MGEGPRDTFDSQDVAGAKTPMFSAEKGGGGHVEASVKEERRSTLLPSDEEVVEAMESTLSVMKRLSS